MSKSPEISLLNKLRLIYRSPDGQVIESYNGSIFEPSNVFTSNKPAIIDLHNVRKPATPEEILSAMNQIPKNNS